MSHIVNLIQYKINTFANEGISLSYRSYEHIPYDADVLHPWGIPHAGDYDLDELFAWIDEICSEE